MENRNCFSLYCIQMETQLIHANLEAMYIALQLMADNEGKGHYEVSIVCRFYVTYKWETQLDTMLTFVVTVRSFFF